MDAVELAAKERRESDAEEAYSGEEETYDDEISELSSSPSIPDENIDFNFVYALHTFVATVEGQATCTKGDYLTLLDDSNSYWWLIRNLKDQSIGYLPAEHIETPPERLARFNKHRNVEYAAPLEEAQEIEAQPVKSTKRKLFSSKKQDRVAFNTPVFIEYDTYYDTEEEQELEALAAEQAAAEQHAPTVEVIADPEITPEPLQKAASPAPDNTAGSIHSDHSNLSDAEKEGGKATKKAKTGILGGLFKRRSSKRDKNDLERITSNEDNDEKGHGVEIPLASPQARRSIMDAATLRASLDAIPFEDSLDTATKAANGLPTRDGRTELPVAVKELQSSNLLTEDLVPEETHIRGPVDELDMLQQRRQSQERPTSKHIPEFSMTDAQIIAHIKDDQFHKNLFSIIRMEARESVRNNRIPLEAQREVDAINAIYNPVEEGLAALARDLDNLFLKTITPT